MFDGQRSVGAGFPRTGLRPKGAFASGPPVEDECHHRPEKSQAQVKQNDS